MVLQVDTTSEGCRDRRFRSWQKPRPAGVGKWRNVWEGQQCGKKSR